MQSLAMDRTIMDLYTHKINLSHIHVHRLHLGDNSLQQINQVFNI